MADPADPWSFNYFDAPSPQAPSPSPKTRTPRAIPEVDRLFQVQRNSLKALGDLDEMRTLRGEKAHVDHALGKLKKDLENTYRVIRTYLAEYVNPESEGL